MFKVAAHRDELERFVELAAEAIDRCELRAPKVKKVPAEDKFVSVFEDHTEIVKVGKSQWPTDIGLISQYEVPSGNPGDDSTLERILNNNIRQYTTRLPGISASTGTITA